MEGSERTSFAVRRLEVLCKLTLLGERSRALSWIPQVQPELNTEVGGQIDKRQDRVVDPNFE